MSCGICAVVSPPIGPALGMGKDATRTGPRSGTECRARLSASNIANMQPVFVMKGNSHLLLLSYKHPMTLSGIRRLQKSATTRNELLSTQLEPMSRRYLMPSLAQDEDFSFPRSRIARGIPSHQRQQCQGMQSGRRDRAHASEHLPRPPFDERILGARKPSQSEDAEYRGNEDFSRFPHFSSSRERT